MRSLSLSNFFDSDNERLNPIFSLSKKFDSDNEFLIYMTNVKKIYVCVRHVTGTGSGLLGEIPRVVVQKSALL
jgi:hypothetical protein